jgi:hypothetical protein
VTFSQPAFGHGGNARFDEEDDMPSRAIARLDDWLQRKEIEAPPATGSPEETRTHIVVNVEAGSSDAELHELAAAILGQMRGIRDAVRGRRAGAEGGGRRAVD